MDVGEVSSRLQLIAVTDGLMTPSCPNRGVVLRPLYEEPINAVKAREVVAASSPNQ